MKREQFQSIQNDVFFKIFKGKEANDGKRYKQNDTKQIITSIMKLIGIEEWQKEKKGNSLHLKKKISFTNSRNYYFFHITVTDYDISFRSFYNCNNGYYGMVKEHDIECSVIFEGKELEADIQYAREDMERVQYVYPQPPNRN